MQSVFNSRHDEIRMKQRLQRRFAYGRLVCCRWDFAYALPSIDSGSDSHEIKSSGLALAQLYGLSNQAPEFFYESASTVLYALLPRVVPEEVTSHLAGIGYRVWGMGYRV